LPAPWHLAAGLLTMRGVSWRDRVRTAGFARRMARNRFECSPQLTVSGLLADQPEVVIALLWEPLCIAALNTPIDTASAQIFLNVMRFAFGAGARDSDLLLPRVDLSTLFPDAAAAFVTDRGGAIRVGTTVGAIVTTNDGVVVTAGYTALHFSAAVVAVGPHQLERLLAAYPQGKAVALALAQAATFTYEPIITTYLKYPAALPVVRPMLKLDGCPGQWLFNRELLDGPAGLVAVVISTESSSAKITHETLASSIDAQLRRFMPGLPSPAWTQVIAERRATYACTPGLRRPAAGLVAPRLYLAGDYTDAELPGTLEAATRSGVTAARALLATHT